MAHVVRPRLRNFLYLDSVGVDSAISQLYGGLPDQERHKTEMVKTREGQAKLASRVLEAGGKRATAATDSSEFMVVSTPEARFNLMLTRLEEASDLDEFTSFDDGTWRGLQLGELISVTALVRIAGIDKITSTLDNVKEFAELGTRFLPVAQTMEIAGAENLATTLTALQTLGEATATSTVLSIVGELRDSPRYKVVAHLNSTSTVARCAMS